MSNTADVARAAVAIPEGSALKVSSAGAVTLLGTSDDASLMVGVALRDAAVGHPVEFETGRVRARMLLDASGSVAAGGGLAPSSTVAGAFRASSAASCGRTRDGAQAGQLVEAYFAGAGGAAPGNPGVFNITDYGAVGDVALDAQGGVTAGTDCSPAVVLALAAMAVARGGTMLVPQGKFRLNSVMAAVSAAFQYATTVFRGRGSNSRLYLTAPTYGLQVDATYSAISFLDLAVCGNGNTGDSGYVPMAIGSYLNGLFERVLFAGLKGSGPASLVLTGLHTAFKDCNFIGCGGPGNTEGLVSFNQAKNVSFVRTNFWDIGGPESFSSNLNNGAWVYFGDPNHAGVDSGAPTGRIHFEDCDFDETSQNKINVDASAAYRWKRLEVIGCTMAITTTAAAALRAKCVRDVRIKDLRVGGTGSGTLRTAVQLIDCGDVVIDGFRANTTGEDCKRIEVDDLTDSVTFIDSVYTLALATATLPPCWDVTNGLRSRWRLSQAAIAANTLVKAGATDGRVDQLAVGDNARLAVGVALDAAAGAGELIRVVEEHGQVVEVKTDGAGALAPGAVLTSSGAAAGRVVATAAAGTNTVGSAVSTVAATLDLLVKVVWHKSQY